MNLKKLIFVSAIALSSTFVFAQDISSGFTRFYGGVAFMKEKNAGSDVKPDKGFQFGIARYINLTGGESPVYLQLGAELNRVAYSETVGGLKAKETLVNMAIPVNLVYHLDLENNMGLEFSAGPNIRINAAGQFKVSDGSNSETLDYFHDLGAHRFQFGLNAGVALTFSRLAISYRFNPDLTDYFDKDELEDNYGEELGDMSSKSVYHFITLGITF